MDETSGRKFEVRVRPLLEPKAQVVKWLAATSVWRLVGQDVAAKGNFFSSKMWIQLRRV